MPPRRAERAIIMSEANSVQLYFSPGSCSLIVRTLLIQVGQHFEAIRLDFSAGDQRRPEFLSVNPKGKVPTLVRDDGSVLTELGTIVRWIGETYRAAVLLPEDGERRLRIGETIEFCISTVHAYGIMRIFVPAAFGPAEAESGIKQQGEEVLARGLAVLDQRLTPQGYVGDELSVGDFVLFWISLCAVFSHVALPPRIVAHYDRMSQLRAVRVALEAEGLA